MDDFDIAVDDDLAELVESGKLDPWKAGQCQLRRDVADLEIQLRDDIAVLQKKMEDRIAKDSWLKIRRRNHAG